MFTVRAATSGDVDELLRLRAVMLTDMRGYPPEPGPWLATTARTLRRRLADGTLAAFVVDPPDRPGRLAACAVGVVEERLASPDNPTGERGYVFNVATDPAYRRRGYSRGCVGALLDWYRERGVATVDLTATPAAEPLYRDLGFTPTANPLLRRSG